MGPRKPTSRLVEPVRLKSIFQTREDDQPKPRLEIPAKGWIDIAWRVLEDFQNDRATPAAAGVTFYARLALVSGHRRGRLSLDGLFTDATTITNHLGLLSGFLPVGAVEVIGDQVKLLTAEGQSTLGFTFIGTLALSLWGANAATKAIFDALNII